MSAAPKVPIPEDYVGEKERRDAAIKEQWVGIYEARIVREKLAECWRTEGVNHYEVCHPLTERYLELIRTKRITGYHKLDFSSNKSS